MKLFVVNNMKLIRIIMYSIMALLVAIPMCVCGHTLLPVEDHRQHSCCNNHEEDKEPSDSGHDCEVSHHDQFSFTLEERETFDFQSVDVDTTPFISYECEPKNPFSGNSLRAPPPDYFSHSSRIITYCIYRL